LFVCSPTAAKDPISRVAAVRPEEAQSFVALHKNPLDRDDARFELAGLFLHTVNVIGQYLKFALAPIGDWNQQDNGDANYEAPNDRRPILKRRLFECRHYLFGARSHCGNEFSNGHRSRSLLDKFLTTPEARTPSPANKPSKKSFAAKASTG